MRILTVPGSYGLHRPVGGGLTGFLRRLSMHVEKGCKVSVLLSEDYRDPRDAQVGDVAYFRDLRVGERNLVVFRDLNPFFAWALQWAILRIRPDVVEFNHPSGMLIGRIIIALSGKQTALVYQAHNVESDFIQDVFASNPTYTRLERSFLPTYTAILEACVCGLIADHITTVSFKDRDRMIQRYRLPLAKVTAIGHGCQLPSPVDIRTKRKLRDTFSLGPNRVVAVFVGASLHTPNVEAARAIEGFIAPAVQDLDKRVLFVIAGAGFQRRTHDNVRCLGYVENLGNLLAAADLAIAPIRTGAGIKLKVLDFLSAGLPLVSTRKAVEGIEAENGKNAMILDEVDHRFVDAIVELAQDENKRKLLGAGARELARSHHGWEEVSSRLDRLYQSVAPTE